MTGEFAGKVVFITGGARGLGKAAAVMFAARGASLFLVDMREEALQATRAELAATGCDCRTWVADIGERQACFDAVAGCVEAFGRLDVLCNVAGIVRFNRVPDVPAEEWAKIMAVNLSGPFHLSQAAIPHLLKTGGNIVNVASQSATMGTAYIVAYAASKGGLVQMSRSMAMEYMREPIRINVVAPGAMRTDIGEGVTLPEGMDEELLRRYYGIRPASPPDEVAEMIVFVASDRARSIHGAVLHVDGGVTAG
jgi:meso-butanediol dehydrogenase/(S,S)-butanediol dehydrogenase/diacetyl reductase